MKTKQVNPMPAFIDSGFDCQFSPDLKNSRIDVGLLGAVETLVTRQSYWLLDSFNSIRGYRQCRPRLNNPQVLPNWGWLDSPLLDGFVWGDWADQTFSSKEIATYYKQDLLRKPISFHVCGVQKGSQLEDWAIENDVPIYNDDMEVVK